MTLSTRHRVWRERGAVNAPMLFLVAALAVVAAITLYWLFTREPAEVPPQPQPAAPPATAEERGDSAREVIADLQEDTAPELDDVAQAYERARQYRAEGRLADAQVLYFFAARGGHGPAAFDLATMYDPNHFESGASVMERPDAYQAYKWYEAAGKSGDPRASERLAALKAWAEAAASTGDAQAERLLLQWEVQS